MTDKQLAEFFVEQRVLQPSQAEDVLGEVELNGKTVAQAMVDGGFIDEPGFYQTIASGARHRFRRPDRIRRSRRKFCTLFPVGWLDCRAPFQLK